MYILSDIILVDSLRLFGIKLFNDDLYELLFRLLVNLAFSYTIILKVYKATRRDSEYLFSYLVFSPMVFFICHLFASTKLSIGFAFGLFAVFSILRYRTTTIPVKEMTYMFVIIGLSVLNAISTKKVSYAELMFTNLFVLGLMYLLERYIMTSGNEIQTVMYEKIENIKPQNESVLVSDLEERTGRLIEKVEILEANYLKDSARIRVYFKKQK
ncbi:DUF4956 domain-containing protein [Salibacteraceae bacterium]|jgi:hypothetical protein|nr:DUF4956 domain-containing protein [Crocinitomicaceae bacterium]MCH9822165.1 DUF4956 domain-containing protein [Bacteroidota bacterium]MDA9968201.1 DUF4956 domain-containing protein [Salibacteraceae bacterium]MDB9725770.1 DUF4956 domain-containing protein [Salibacteraceae bacterium]MDC1203782.1 DUF4956 domain-containing protein [Salibacteraceae bacterium]|tara:strand:+ start:180338 stop:180976 length:639 start_codon:yes stop_codon:yes gene_type:complete